MQTLMTITAHTAVPVQNYLVRNESRLLKLDAQPPPKLQRLVWDCR
jgi:hypothetical protein